MKSEQWFICSPIKMADNKYTKSREIRKVQVLGRIWNFLPVSTLSACCPEAPASFSAPKLAGEVMFYTQHCWQVKGQCHGNTNGIISLFSFHHPPPKLCKIFEGPHIFFFPLESNYCLYRSEMLQKKESLFTLKSVESIASLQRWRLKLDHVTNLHQSAPFYGFMAVGSTT